MPGREQNGPMSAVPTPSGPWVPWATTNSTIPRPVWQTVNLSDRKEGRDVVLAFVLHGLCTITSDTTKGTLLGKLTKTLDEEREEFVIRDEVFDFKTVRSTA